MVIERHLRLNPKRNYLLLGPRRVGKTTFLHIACPDATFIDLLKSDVFFDYHANPSLLRERFGYDGELRATGQVLRDQFVFMLRAGFDAFEAKKESDANAFAVTEQRYSVFYQPTGDGRLTALHRRMLQRHSESARS